MCNDDRPGSPSPTLVEQYAEDPDLDIDWAGISVLYTRDDGAPSTLPPPCERFNNDVCLCQSTCPQPHVCSTCFQPGHSTSSCSKKVEAARARYNRKGMAWDEDVSYSPCAQASLDAAPLPRPPPLHELPPELVRVVHEHPGLFKIVSPVKVDVFEGLLALHPNQEFVKSVIIGLREGFWPFASPPRVLVNESRRQRRLRGPKKEFLEQHVKKEISSGRFSRPFGRRLLKGMACMPVHVAQSGSQKKFRLIYDHSAGEHSLNSLIPASERGAQADRIDALIRMLRNRGLNLADVVLFKSDVSRAFRILPMSPYWQVLQAVKINDLYYIDRCNSFGNAGSQRLFCAFYSLVLWIAENIWRLTDIFSYVDDNFSWEYATRMKYYRPFNRELPEKQARLLEIWDCLGIPHALEKQEFSSVLTIIGFRVDLRNKRITISEERLERLVKSLLEFCAAPSRTVPLHECQILAGSINWTFEVNPLLRPGISSLHKVMSKPNQSTDNTLVTLTKQVVSDLKWLAKFLRKSKGVHLTRIGSWGPEEASQVAYVHASTEGFGIWYPLKKQAFFCRYGIPAPDYSISDSHTFALVCAIYKAKTWKTPLYKGPGRLAIFTCDKFTVDMFDQVHARDELRHVLLLGMELLANADMDYMVSQAGNEADFYFAARLSRETKETLVLNYPDVTLEEFIVPPRLAKRAHWKLDSAGHVSSHFVSTGASRQFSESEAVDEGKDGGKDLLTRAEQSKSEFIPPFLVQTRKLAKHLTYDFR